MAHYPLVDSLLKEIGIDAAEINGLTKALRKAPEKWEESSGATPKRPYP